MFYRLLLTGSAGFVAVGLLSGCDLFQGEDSGSPCDDCISGIAVSFQGTAENHIVFCPWWTGGALMYVRTFDENGWGVGGVPVEIFLSDPSLGLIATVSGNYPDTTDENGWLIVPYSFSAQTGRQEITAWAQAQADVGVIEWLNSTATYSLDTANAVVDSAIGFSCRVCVTVRSASGNGIPDVFALPNATGGGIGYDPFDAVTDESGNRCYSWLLHNQHHGHYCVWVPGDTICVDVP
jgi:hypothetical protein